ncbi:MAG: ATP-binding protein [Pseudomonadota bacterium]
MTLHRPPTQRLRAPDTNWRWTPAELRPNMGRILRWVVPGACIALVAYLASVGDNQLMMMGALCMTALMGIIGARGYGLKARELRAALTEMEAVRDAAWETREKAEAASAAKSQFLAAVSHEVRTPLSGILGMNGLLLDSKLTGEQRAYADAIARSGEALTALINDLLDITLIEKGRLNLEPSATAVDDLAASVVELMASRADEKGLDIALYVAPSVPAKVKLDAGRLRQILMNILGNAIKFTETGGALMEVDLADDTLIFRVQDTGPGVPKLDRERLFDEFERREATETRTQVGLGLGLAISRRLATAMGGTLAFVDQPDAELGAAIELRLPATIPAAPVLHRPATIGASAPVCTPMPAPQNVVWVGEPSFTAHVMERFVRDAGAKFHFAAPDALLPAGSLVVVADAEVETLQTVVRHANDGQVVACLPAKDRDQLGALRDAGADGHIIRPLRRDTISRLLSGELIHALESEPAPKTALTNRSETARHVLFVEDDPVNRLLVRTLLERRGHKVTIMHDALEASKVLLVAGHEFDALVTDLHLPGLSGQQLLQALREHEDRLALAPLTTVVLTADARAELVRELEPLKPAALLTKPLNAAELMAAVEQTVRPESHTCASDRQRA